ncbi:MAG: late control D family [Desulfovibrionaceae bacterium]|nr:MAG: late control D family [Desulfovibrionaceae bacterium]
MAEVKARRARLVIVYENRDISQDIAPYVVGFSFTDNAHGKSDEIALTLEDREHLWKGGWYPEKGARITARLECEHWAGDAAAPMVLECGTFTLDEIDLDGPPDVVKLKAVSASVTRSLRQEDKSRAWENASLETVAGDIAKKHGLELYYDGPAHRFQRMDQRQISDLGFLREQAEARGMRLKVTGDKLVLVSGDTLDAQAPSGTLTRGSSDIKTFSLKQKTQGTFGGGGEVSFHDAVSKQTRTYVAAGKGKGEKLQVNRRVDPLENGQDRAETAVRDRDRAEFEGRFTLVGDPGLRAGLTISVGGFKRFDRTYLIDTARHSLDSGGGYTVEITLKTALGGGDASAG